MNEQGWPVVAPFRYGGEILCDFNEESEIVGDYKFVDHGTSVSADIVNSSVVSLRADGSISGDVSGSWKSVDRKSLKIRLNGKEYSGFFIPQTDMNTGRQTNIIKCHCSLKGRNIICVHNGMKLKLIMIVHI